MAHPVRDCSTTRERAALCRDDLEYMDLNWEVRYRFDLDRLTQVLLLTDYGPDAKETALKTLAGEFFLAAMKSGNQVLDVVSLARRKPRKKVLQTAARFEQMGLARSNLVYVLFEKKRFGRQARTAKNVRELMLKMSAFTREVDIWVDGSNGEKLLVISFAIPRATLKLKKEWSKPQKEVLQKEVSRIPDEKNPIFKPRVSTPPAPNYPGASRFRKGRL